MEFGPLFLAFLLGGLVFAPIVNAIDSVLGHTIANTTRNLAKSTIVLLLELADRAKVAGSELGEAFQDLVAEAQADRRTGDPSNASASTPTEVEIDAD
ncbi:MAG: DUF5132 domain-containing protein [Oscillatoriales cyanobacterium]|jgi:hypothetical protein|nr:MAG: DUF5132 domain-containing protein [Oscillatoriales cyanobacterium]